MAETIGQVQSRTLPAEEKRWKSSSSRSSTVAKTTSPTSPAITKLIERYPTPEKLLASYNPGFQVRYCQDKQRAFLGGAPELYLVKQAYGEGTALSWLIVQLSNLSEFAGCKEKLSPPILRELAQMMLQQYGYYKLTEFMCFFQSFKQCRYGRFYGAVDPMLILEALKRFHNEERVPAREDYEREQHRLWVEEQTRRHDAIHERYRRLVPDADTEKALVDFCRFEQFGWHLCSDEEVAQHLDNIANGRYVPPDGFFNVLAERAKHRDKEPKDKRTGLSFREIVQRQLDNIRERRQAERDGTEG